MPDNWATTDAHALLTRLSSVCPNPIPVAWVEAALRTAEERGARGFQERAVREIEAAATVAAEAAAPRLYEAAQLMARLIASLPLVGAEKAEE